MVNKNTDRERERPTHHGVDDVLELDHDDALDGHSDLLRQIAASDGVADPSDVLDLCLEKMELLDGAHAAVERRETERGRRRAVDVRDAVVQPNGVGDGPSAGGTVGGRRRRRVALNGRGHADVLVRHGTDIVDVADAASLLGVRSVGVPDGGESVFGIVQSLEEGRERDEDRVGEGIGRTVVVGDRTRQIVDRQQTGQIQQKPILGAHRGRDTHCYYVRRLYKTLA